ncbi:NO signaling/Golgi transport ligand-binding domain-containing protein [Dunaliella salina]|uniref:Trafficking protein particle complex subunit n=1 Tax=Dunaliella salina TaxID=3046 RepID=A0ABQ7G6K0_DUNSA|nr:NO signaling/Golgi transport ligand-binding domain-containing protein [Dunaliella salina]|eukprot:KAF5830224.1 NO signaling/Golgi transport ligand-binding domain-containing protein [Dunaliella salina]
MSHLQVPTVSLSAYAYLLSELIQYAVDRANNVQELEDRLDGVGYEVGARLIERISYGERALRRKPEILDILKWIHSTAWPWIFGKPADSLEHAAAAEDEFMLSDFDLLLSRFISVPKAYGGFTAGSLAAGMVRGMLACAGFPARVSAHVIEHRERPKTTLLIKFDPVVMIRQAQLERK